MLDSIIIYGCWWISWLSCSFTSLFLRDGIRSRQVVVSRYRGRLFELQKSSSKRITSDTSLPRRPRRLGRCDPLAEWLKDGSDGFFFKPGSCEKWATGRDWCDKMDPLHSWKLTWNITMEVWKVIILSKWVIFRFQVNCPGCTQTDGMVFQYRHVLV